MSLVLSVSSLLSLWPDAGRENAPIFKMVSHWYFMFHFNLLPGFQLLITLVSNMWWG